MTIKELQLEKENNEMMIATVSHQKEVLEDLASVKSYLEQLVALERGNIYRRFLQQLEIGEDGTVFTPCSANKDKAFSDTHFGLSVILKYVFGYVQKEFEKDEVIGLKISFDTLEQYIDNAYQVLTDMNYKVGDRKVDNDYGLEIYENPKNYSVVDFKTIRPTLTNEQFKNGYNVSGILVEDDSFIALREMMFSDNDYQKMSPREQEAFFGEKAKQILGFSGKGRVKK